MSCVDLLPATVFFNIKRPSLPPSFKRRHIKPLGGFQPQICIAVGSLSTFDTYSRWEIFNLLTYTAVGREDSVFIQSRNGGKPLLYSCNCTHMTEAAYE